MFLTLNIQNFFFKLVFTEMFVVSILNYVWFLLGLHDCNYVSVFLDCIKSAHFRNVKILFFYLGQKEKNPPVSGNAGEEKNLHPGGREKIFFDELN